MSGSEAGNYCAGSSVEGSGGPYAINQNTLAANANYTLTSDTGHSLAITPAGLTIRVDDRWRVRNTANPPFTAPYNGFKFKRD